MLDSILRPQKIIKNTDKAETIYGLDRIGDF